MRNLTYYPKELSTHVLLDLYDASGPHVSGGMVQSADGTAVLDGSSRPLSPPADREVFRTLRAVADVVLVGAGTARAEDYGAVPVRADRQQWRRDRGRTDAPRLAVVSRTLDLPASAVAARPVVLTCASAPPERLRALAPAVDLVVVGQDDVDLAAGLAALRERGLGRVLCEGGPRLLGDLVAAGLLTELCVTVSPLLAGAGPGLVAAPVTVPVPVTLAHVLEQDGCLLLRYVL